jgi:acyl-CoA reductase-like NAD-dependent aldehyde dehydrogenase
VAKGNETVEYACSLPQLAQGNSLKVSGAVTCVDRRDPLGVVASIVPFNFPFMVPMWTLPIALVMGNTVVLKPSEKVPLTMYRVAKLFEDAGFPPGVFNMVQGSREAVKSLVDHPSVKAVTFVGSSPVAKIISDRCRALDKRCTALGGTFRTTQNEIRIKQSCPRICCFALLFIEKSYL